MSKLKQLREEKGLTQIELSELTGIKQTTISYLEREGIFVSENIITLADFYGAEISELFEENKE